MPIIVNPAGLAPPRGYSNGLVLKGDSTLFVAGQIGWDEACVLVSDDFVEQFQKALDNVLEVVTEAGGDATRIGRLTIYVTDKAVYMAAAKEIGRAYRARMGDHYPAMSLVEVADLLEPGAQVEIEATAILGDDA